MTYPRTAYLLRHAEENPSDPTDIHLSAAGRKRAVALVELFGRGGRFAGAQFLIAADRSKHSNRSAETLQPLALATGLRLNTEFEDDEWKDLAARLVGKKAGKKYADAVVVIAWHHHSLPALAKALGVPAKALPWKEWPNDVYDQVWVLRFDASGVRSIESEPQWLDV